MRESGGGEAKRRGIENTQSDLADRQSEATSKETLKDLQETDSKPGKPPDETSVPSPDGTPNAGRSRGRADGSDTGDPM